MKGTNVMQRTKVAIVCLAALLIILAATINKWSGRVGLTDNHALIMIFGAELLLFVGLVLSMRHHVS